MKYMKRAKIYKGPNVTFNPADIRAYSYRWWRFVDLVEGKVVFNNYSYSVSTSRHQRKVLNLLSSLGIKIDLMLPVPKGLQDYHSLEEIITVSEEHLCDKFLTKTIKNQDKYQQLKQQRILKMLEPSNIQATIINEVTK